MLLIDWFAVRHPEATNAADPCCAELTAKHLEYQTNLWERRVVIYRYHSDMRHSILSLIENFAGASVHIQYADLAAA
jgi:hypothetical protein